MNYTDNKLAQARCLLGQCIEIPVHYDMWMRGARFGRVTSIGKDGEYVRVALDIYPRGFKYRLKIWRIDFDYIRVL